MQKRIILVLISVVLVLPLFAQKSTLLANDVKAADEAFAKSWAAKDLDGALKFYAEDAVTMEPGMPIVKGKPAIRKFLQAFLADKTSALNWTADTAEVAKSGDLAYTRGSFDAQFTDPSGKLIKEHGKYVTIWKKIGKEWKVIVDINNSDLPQ